MNANEQLQNQLLIAISKVVQRRREELTLTQEELAHRAGLHRTYISDIERGARNLSVKSLIRLAGALEMSVSGMLETAESKVNGGDNGTSNSVESSAHSA
jgi:transcriptional regulator with XRE-family HTH domain